MNEGLSFVAFSLSLIGALVIFCGCAFALAGMDRNYPDTRLAGYWRLVANTSWRNIVGEGLNLSLRWLDRMIRSLFEEADKRPLLDILFLGIVLFFVPIAAAVNASLGGSPFLLKAYVVFFVLFALLMVFSQFDDGNWAFSFIKGTLALALGLGLFLGVPLYVLVSFTERILHENISHAFLLSILIAPFYYVCAIAAMNYLELFLGKDPTVGRTGVVVFFRGFLAALPVAFVVVFFALLLGQLAVSQAVPTRSVQMFLVSVVVSAISVPSAICVFSPILQDRSLVRLLPNLLNGLVTAMGLSIALLYLSYYSTIKELSLAECVNVLFGLDANGQGVFLGPDFWVMHIPFVVPLGVIGFCLVCALAKILMKIPGLLTKPNFAMAGLLGLIGVWLFISGRFLI